MLGALETLALSENGLGERVDIGGNAAAFLADIAGKVALDEEMVPSDDITDLLGIDFLLDSNFSGVFDSATSREMISLPSASFSGVVPNLAMRVSELRACSIEIIIK